jgi:hypothetical protein
MAQTPKMGSTPALNDAELGASTPALDSDSNAPHSLLDIIVDNKYRIGRKIGSGSFGEIFLGARPSLSPPFTLFLFILTPSLLLSIESILSLGAVSHLFEKRSAGFVYF